MQRHHAAGEALEGDATEISAADHVGELRGLGKLADRLDEIAIGLGVAGHGAADRRDDVERIEVVEPVKARHVDRGELQADEMSAELQHAMDLAERHVDARHVADAERDGDGVEALVRERQRLGVRVDELNVAPRLLGALAANLLSPEDMQGWGWRILFVVGGILAFIFSWNNFIFSNVYLFFLNKYLK